LILEVFTLSVGSEVSNKGLKRGTPFERFISAFRIPHILGSIIIASIVGPPGAIILSYVDTRDFNLSIGKTVWLFLGIETTELYATLALIVVFTILFYCIYIIQHVRLQLISACRELLPILPEGEATFLNAFKPVISVRYPLLIGASIIILANLETLNNFLGFGTNTIDLIYFTLCLMVWAVIAGQFVWVYVSSVLGLYNLGRSSLKLRNHKIDKMLGVKPIGSLSLFLAFIYLLLFGGFVLLASAFSLRSPVFVTLILVLIVSGVVVFFLPLYSTHKRMVEAKKKEQERINQLIEKAVEAQNQLLKDHPETSIPEHQLTSSYSLLDIHTRERSEINQIRTWPIDAEIRGKLAYMITVISCTILAQMILRMIL
jgi:hypothetical protein